MGWCVPWLLIPTKKTIGNANGETCLELEAPHEGHSSVSPSSFELAQPACYHSKSKSFPRPINRSEFGSMVPKDSRDPTHPAPRLCAL